MDNHSNQTIDAAAFEARCADLLDQVETGRIERLDVTRDGKVIAVLASPTPTLFGFLRGTVTMPEGFDPTAPVFEGTIHAEEGRIHE